jgi:cell division protein FtsB
VAKRPLSLRLSILGLIGLLVVLQGRLWLTDDGWREVSRLRASVATQEAENEKLMERNARLKAEVSDLKEGSEALEELARSDLGMVGPDESFFLFVPVDSQDETNN